MSPGQLGTRAFVLPGHLYPGILAPGQMRPGLGSEHRNKRICSRNLSLTQDKLRTRLVRNHEVIIFTLEIHFTRLYFANVSMKSILVLLTGAQGQVVELGNQIRHLDNTRYWKKLTNFIIC